MRLPLYILINWGKTVHYSEKLRGVEKIEKRDQEEKDRGK